MITTVTLHPSIDRTIELAGDLEPGQVHRNSTPPVDVPAGKGVNVTRTLQSLGTASLAIVAANPTDPFVTALQALDVAVAAIPVMGNVRCNLTLVSPNGETTKLNAQGPPLDVEAVQTLTAAVRDAAQHSTWIVIAGSVPSATEPSLCASLVTAAREANPGICVAVDSSGPTLAALAAVASLVKPNEHELAELLGLDSGALAEPTAAVHAAQQVHEQYGCDVLLTLGADGAALVTSAGTWHAPSPSIRVRSTVGAGDASLAGYLAALATDHSPPECLRAAISAGSAAAALPGTTIPTREHVAAVAVTHPTLWQEHA